MNATPGNPNDQALQTLTPAQRLVLERLVQGKQRKEIAAEMKLSERGVDYHCERIFRALHVQTNVDAVRVALETPGLCLSTVARPLPSVR